MELNKQELVLVEEASEKADDVVALNDLQLALIGGGSGEVVFH